MRKKQCPIRVGRILAASAPACRLDPDVRPPGDGLGGPIGPSHNRVTTAPCSWRLVTVDATPSPSSIPARTMASARLSSGRAVLASMRTGASAGVPDRQPLMAVRYCSSISVAIAGMVNDASTHIRAARPILCLSGASWARRTIASARASGSPGGTISPVLPSRTHSGIPPAEVATTGIPHAIASMAVFGELSYSEGTTAIADL